MPVVASFDRSGSMNEPTRNGECSVPIDGPDANTSGGECRSLNCERDDWPHPPHPYIKEDRFTPASGDTAVGFAIARAGTYKRIHRSSCRYARRPYPWADQFRGDEDALLYELMLTGASNWHLGCRVCCPDLDDGLRNARAAHQRMVVLDHIAASNGSSAP